jgi:hypothetical protein
MPGLVPGIHALHSGVDDWTGVDGRDELVLGPAEGRTRVPGHDGRLSATDRHHASHRLRRL